MFNVILSLPKYDYDAQKICTHFDKLNVTNLFVAFCHIELAEI